MRQDWIEFEVDNGKLFVKYYDIESIRHAFSKIYGSCASISLSNGTSHRILEPYEQVKQKIMDAEKYDLNDVVVERFTKDEYKYLLKAMNYYAQTPAESEADSKKFIKIRDKLNEIIEEME